MITARPAIRPRSAPHPVRSDDDRAGGGRHGRRLERRRRIREQLVVGLVLLVLLAVTVGLLALQWLDSSPTQTSLGAFAMLPGGSP